MSRANARCRVGDFDENSPRPPVPGEETDACCSSAPAHSPPPPPYKYTPRSSKFKIHSTADLEGNAPLGFEPEGSCSRNHGSCSPFYEGTRSPPSCFQWAKSLDHLVQDEEGVALFQKYLEQEGKPHLEALLFWFACEGLKKQSDKKTISRIIKVIFKHYINRLMVPISDELRSQLTRKVRENSGDPEIFNAAQEEVWKRITTTTYPNFLESEIFLNHIRQVSQSYSSTSGSGSSSGSSSSSAGRDAAIFGGPGLPLPTVHEDSEYVVNPDPLPLTRNALMATQSRRALELRPKPEAYAGVYLQHGVQITTRVYSSYNPVSRQDSEMQSLSSDARTDSDALSCADSSMDGSSANYQKMSKRQNQKLYKWMKENASLNREGLDNIPRTSRQRLQQHPKSPEELAKLLIEKLEILKRQQDEQEKLTFKLSETEKGGKLLADVIREKFQVEEQDCDQAILDQHVSRVWSDTTPSRSPGLISPRPKSPDCRRKMITAAVPHPYQTRSAYPRYPKKEKDVFSTFSSDSGNIHDFPDIPEPGRHFPKSKSVPDYADAQNSLPGYEGQCRSSREMNRRSINKKSTAELCDSGVSVASDTGPVAYPIQAKDKERIVEWVKDSASIHRPVKQSSVISSGTCRHGRKSERSGSLERCPQQPFVADPSMPPLPSPNTATQLEEARRRLIADDIRGKGVRQRLQPSSKTSGAPLPPDVSLSNQSTLRKSLRRTEPLPQQPLQQRPVASEQEFTTVMYSFCDEQVPYRTKILGKPVTLKQFKDILPRKGLYRYFFKTDCSEVMLNATAINQEVVDDNEECPLWEGKLIAQVVKQVE